VTATTRNIPIRQVLSIHGQRESHWIRAAVTVDIEGKIEMRVGITRDGHVGLPVAEPNAGQVLVLSSGVAYAQEPERAAITIAEPSCTYSPHRLRGASRANVRSSAMLGFTWHVWAAAFSVAS
jgi:hypothetical protein